MSEAQSTGNAPIIENLEANKNQLKDGLKIVGDFLNKSVLIPNNINFPMSRNEFIKLI